MSENNQEILEDPSQQHKVEQKTVPLTFLREDKVSTFITIMRHPDAAVAFNREVASQLQRIIMFAMGFVIIMGWI